MKHLILFLFFMLALKAFGQINMADSTAQVIGYWDLNEKQSYTITNEKYKISGSDTTSREFWNYDVDITIVDSTENSYTIEWYYNNYNVNSDNELVKKLASLSEEMKVIIKTDELGAVVGVENWMDIKKEMRKMTSELKKELRDLPQMDKVVEQIESMFSSKEAIEAAAIKDIQQFYTYHGGLYKLGEEVKANMQLPNLYGGAPFDTEVVLWLDEINPDDGNFIIRMEQEVNSEQLTNATYEFITRMAGNLNTPLPKREEFPALSNNIWVASRIHDSGWVIYSVETREVYADNVISFEERIIELK